MMVAMEEIMRIVFTCLPTAPSHSSDGEDRISRLPDKLLRNIVSRLPAKDAGRTATLSRRWCRVWASASPLVLDDSDLVLLPGDAHRPARIDWMSVTDAVSRVILYHRDPVRFLRLTCCDMEMLARYGGLHHCDWLRLLADRGAEDLVRIASFRTLYIGFWRFPYTAGLPRRRVPRLREIGLGFTAIDAGDINYLLDFSPVLEKLSIVASLYHDGGFRIRSRSLQCLVFWHALAIGVDVVVAPRLHRLILWTGCLGPGLATRLCWLPRKAQDWLRLSAQGAQLPGARHPPAQDWGHNNLEWNKYDPI